MTLINSLHTKVSNLFADVSYGEIGLFLKKNPRSFEYTYSNWGSRPWEHYYVKNILNEIGVENKRVVVLSAFEHFPISIFKKTAKEIYRVLKKDGHLVVTLDLTYQDHKRFARWAILEKTLNRLPETAKGLSLPKNFEPFSLIKFLDLISSYFYVKNPYIWNLNKKSKELVLSKEWNSYVGYVHLYKK